MEIPEVRYTSVGDGLLAWQSWGQGDRTIIDCGVGPNFSIDDIPDEPHWLRYISRLAGFARVLVFDYPGTGLSDEVQGRPITYELLAEAVRAVLDAAGVDRAVVLAASRRTPVAIHFTAEHPERVDRIALINAWARIAQGPDYPYGASQQYIDAALATINPLSDVRSDGPTDLQTMAPSHASDPTFRSWWVRSARRATSPHVALAMARMIFETDVRELLPTISAPALVIQRRDAAMTGPELGRYVAKRLPNCRYVELDGADWLPFAGDSGPIIDEIQEFVTGSRYGGTPERAFAVVLMTDIVGSTALASQLGDRRWREIQQLHHETVRRVLSRHDGIFVQDLGDGTLCTFRAPGQAIHAALDIRDAVGHLDLEIRAGLHAGEIELRGSDVAGINVHLAARVAALAGPSEVLVSSTMVDLVAGSGFTFKDKGLFEMKGIPGARQVWAVERPSLPGGRPGAP